MGKWAIGFCLGLAAWTPALPGNVREETLVRRIQWPVTIEPRVPNGCADASSETVKITEDGVEVPVDVLERQRLPAIHTILIDTSSSMQWRLDAAKEAARTYLERLPSDEPAMLATFSDNLIVNEALTTDREALIQALEEIDSYADTALNDALYYIVRHLAGRSERKILILLSDGCDSASLSAHSLDSVVDLATELPNLTVFPIGIDLPSRCETSMLTAARTNSPLLPLEKLALNSGGHLYRTRESSGLDKIFDDIFMRVQSEGFVSYRPLYHGEGARDRPGATVKRRVRIESRSPKRCKIGSAGPRTRTERAPDEAATTAAVNSIRYRDWWSDSRDGLEPVGRLDLGETAMLGHGADLQRELSWLFSGPAYYFDGRYLAERNRSVRLHTRDYRVEVPPFEHLTTSLTDPTSILVHLLKIDAVPFLPLPDARTRRDRARRRLGQNWVHGQTLLEIREALGRGLFSYPGYREFAYRKAREEYRAEMQRTLRVSSEVRALAQEDRERLEQLVAARRPEPTDGQLQHYLADWLGDIRAHDLVVELESRAVDAALDPTLPQAEWPDWSTLGMWFPPPTQVRIISPLIPQYDPRRDVVGFWRIVLPEVTHSAAPFDSVPENPLGLIFTRKLVEILEPRSERLRLGDLTYHWAEKTERRRIVRGARRQELISRNVPWSTIPVVSMTLGPEDEEGLSFTVLWTPGDSPPEPACIDLGEAGALPDGAWVETLRYALLELAPECVPPNAG